jgi:hypothetical protein
MSVLAVRAGCCATDRATAAALRRRLPEEDLSVREMRISCPDATGLGVDIARMLLDFGLRILKGDISTDGQWCFIIFKVCLSAGARGGRWGAGTAGEAWGGRGAAWSHACATARQPVARAEHAAAMAWVGC